MLKRRFEINTDFCLKGFFTTKTPSSADTVKPTLQPAAPEEEEPPSRWQQDGAEADDGEMV